jgi:hypothetical protein
MSKDTELKKYVADLLEKSVSTGDTKEVAKWAIIWASFYKEVKPEIGMLPLKQLKRFALKYLVTTIQFETVCAKAYTPLSGSQSTADDIISMYSNKLLDKEEIKQN